MRFLLILLALIGPTAEAFADLSEARFVGQTKGVNFEVRMRFKPARSDPRYPDAHEAWTIFDSMRVTLAGRDTEVPKAVLDKFFWPHPSGAPYLNSDNTLRVPISGGSGESSYNAVLVFSKKRLVQVERRDGASETWETTKYRRR